ncbi:hypothetical protein ACPESV_24415 [Streptomyces umbrinus]|uniref:hypothetical protein n=1 Tax=Streptomyces umbrinus TaxID=67370 RepID=UPI003C2CC430
MPVEAYRTWSVQSRPDKRVKSVCERVRCAAWRSGWESVIDESTPLGQEQAKFIRGSRRTFKEQKTAAGLTVFRFESGQRCFADHQTMPELYLVRGGDYRAKVGEVRVHKNSTDWVEHVQQHMGLLLDERDKG